MDGLCQPTRLDGCRIGFYFSVAYTRNLKLETELCAVEWYKKNAILRLVSEDGTNRLSIARVRALTEAVEQLASDSPAKLVLTGNTHFFSAGADLHEIAAIAGSEAVRFALMGQTLMNAVAGFPAPTIAAIHGYCMGGGLDLALACQRRIAGPHAIFGHRGAAFGLMTGWGGTQRLPRIVGKACALEMFIAAEKLNARRALAFGLVEAVVDDPLARALAV